MSFNSLFSTREITPLMVDADPCQLHEVAILIGTDESENLLRLGRSPIGDECRRCQVCRSARTVRPATIGRTVRAEAPLGAER